MVFLTTYSPSSQMLIVLSIEPKFGDHIPGKFHHFDIENVFERKCRFFRAYFLMCTTLRRATHLKIHLVKFNSEKYIPAQCFTFHLHQFSSERTIIIMTWRSFLFECDIIPSCILLCVVEPIKIENIQWNSSMLYQSLSAFKEDEEK